MPEPLVLGPALWLVTSTTMFYSFPAAHGWNLRKKEDTTSTRVCSKSNCHLCHSRQGLLPSQAEVSKRGDLFEPGDPHEIGLLRRPVLNSRPIPLSQRDLCGGRHICLLRAIGVASAEFSWRLQGDMGRERVEVCKPKPTAIWSVSDTYYNVHHNWIHDGNYYREQQVNYGKSGCFSKWGNGNLPFILFY